MFSMFGMSSMFSMSSMSRLEFAKLCKKAFENLGIGLFAAGAAWGLVEALKTGSPIEILAAVSDAIAVTFFNETFPISGEKQKALAFLVFAATEFRAALKGGEASSWVMAGSCSVGFLSELMKLFSRECERSGDSLHLISLVGIVAGSALDANYLFVSGAGAAFLNSLHDFITGQAAKSDSTGQSWLRTTLLNLVMLVVPPAAACASPRSLGVSLPVSAVTYAMIKGCQAVHEGRATSGAQGVAYSSPVRQPPPGSRRVSFFCCRRSLCDSDADSPPAGQALLAGQD